MSQVLETGAVLDRVGLKPLSPQEIQDTSDAYADHLRRGLARQGGSLRMIDTLLTPLSHPALPNGRVLVAEAGGTNVRAGIVENVNGHLRLVASQTRPWATTKFSGVEKFFEAVAEPVGLLDMQPGIGIKTLALVFSFPGEAQRTANGLDVRALPLTKGFEVGGIDQEPVGEVLLRVLRRKHGFPNMPLAVLNDTPAVQLAYSKAKMGVVAGTGFNIAVGLGGSIYNTESGGFSAAPTHPIAEAVDQADNPGSQLGEKQIGGMYLGAQLVTAMDLLREMRIWDIGSNQFTSSETITAALLSDKEALKQQINGSIDDDSLLALQVLSARIRTRSAQLVGTMVGTLIRTFPREFETSKIVVSVEGSVFWKMPEYQTIVRRYADEIGRREVHFPQIDQPGRIGAAAAALSFLN